MTNVEYNFLTEDDIDRVSLFIKNHSESIEQRIMDINYIKFDTEKGYLFQSTCSKYRVTEFKNTVTVECILKKYNLSKRWLQVEVDRPQKNGWDKTVAIFIMDKYTGKLHYRYFNHFNNWSYTYCYENEHLAVCDCEYDYWEIFKTRKRQEKIEKLLQAEA